MVCRSQKVCLCQESLRLKGQNSSTIMTHHWHEPLMQMQSQSDGSSQASSPRVHACTHRHYSYFHPYCHSYVQACRSTTLTDHLLIYHTIPSHSPSKRTILHTSRLARSYILTCNHAYIHI